MCGSEDDILLFFFDLLLLVKEVLILLFFVDAIICLSGFLHLNGLLFFFFFLGLKLLVLHALKSIEVLSVQLVELGLNPLDGGLDPGQDDELEGIDSSVCELELLLYGHELSLQGGDLHEEFQVILEFFLSFHDSLTTTSDTNVTVIVRIL